MTMARPDLLIVDVEEQPAGSAVPAWTPTAEGVTLGSVFPDEPEELAAAAAALERGGNHFGGGGASPLYRISLHGTVALTRRRKIATLAPLLPLLSAALADRSIDAIAAEIGPDGMEVCARFAEAVATVTGRLAETHAAESRRAESQARDNLTNALASAPAHSGGPYGRH